MKDLQWIDACIDEEPEYPESPPPEMVLTLQRAIEDADIDLLSEAFRITVRLTKQGIKDRIHERASLPSPSPIADRLATALRNLVAVVGDKMLGCPPEAVTVALKAGDAALAEYNASKGERK